MDNKSLGKIFEQVKIPKTIWFFWEQGLDNAPYIVKKCYASWKKYNQNWDLILLDGKNICDYLPNLSQVIAKNAKFLEKRKALYADIVRINLLNKYGGVWVDATCFCCQPLEKWLGKYSYSGFFAFRNIHKDRLIESWFIVSSPNSIITNKWCKEINNLMQKHSYKCYWHEYYKYNASLLDALMQSAPNKKKLHLFFLKAGNKLRTIVTVFTQKQSIFSILWMTTPILKLGYLPYFCICNLFIKVVFTNIKCKKIWQSVPEFNVRKNDARINGLGSGGSINAPIPSYMKEHVDMRKAPVYKLTYKIEIQFSNDEETQMQSYHYLLRSHGLGETSTDVNC